MLTPLGPASWLPLPPLLLLLLLLLLPSIMHAALCTLIPCCCAAVVTASAAGLVAAGADGAAATAPAPELSCHPVIEGLLQRVKQQPGVIPRHAPLDKRKLLQAAQPLRHHASGHAAILEARAAGMQ